MVAEHGEKSTGTNISVKEQIEKFEKHICSSSNGSDKQLEQQQQQEMNISKDIPKTTTTTTEERTSKNTTNDEHTPRSISREELTTTTEEGTSGNRSRGGSKGSDDTRTKIGEMMAKVSKLEKMVATLLKEGKIREVKEDIYGRKMSRVIEGGGEEEEPDLVAKTIEEAIDEKKIMRGTATKWFDDKASACQSERKI